MTSAKLRRAISAALMICLVSLTGGCGDDEGPSALPVLSAKLAEVDQALDLRRFAVARRHLKELLEDTVEAREAGDLDPSQANRILASIAELTAALPAPSPAPSATASPTPAAEPRKDDPEKKDSGKGNGGKGDDKEDDD